MLLLQPTEDALTTSQIGCRGGFFYYYNIANFDFHNGSSLTEFPTPLSFWFCTCFLEDVFDLVYLGYRWELFVSGNYFKQV